MHRDSYGIIADLASMMTIAGGVQTASVVINIDFKWPVIVIQLWEKISAICSFNMIEVTSPQCL